MNGPLSSLLWAVPFAIVGAGFALDWTSRRGSAREQCAFALYCAANLMIAGLDVASGAPWWALLSLGAAAWWAWRWWRNRRRRKRALAVLGAKSRALIAAMVRRLRSAARPRTGLRPVPQPG